MELLLLHLELLLQLLLWRRTPARLVIICIIARRPGVLRVLQLLLRWRCIGVYRLVVIVEVALLVHATKVSHAGSVSSCLLNLC